MATFVSLVSSMILGVGVFVACLYVISITFGTSTQEHTEAQKCMWLVMVTIFPFFMALAAVVFKYIWS